MLSLEGLSSGYGRVEVLHSISLEISKPAIYVVLGPNGAGKTTLFRTVAGVLKPTAGKVTLDGRDLYSAGPLRREIGYLSHLTALPEEMSVARALGFYGGVEEGDPTRAMEALGIPDLAEKKVSNLSQGQRKRVSIAKLFLRQRRLYLMDEPTSNLDPVVAKEVRDILLTLSRDKFVLYSSHNLYEAQEIGDFVIMVKDGRLGFYGRKEELRSGMYSVGLKASGDLGKLFPEGRQEKGYYVLDVGGPAGVAELVKRMVDAGMAVYEVRELGNPLEELFSGGS